MSDLMSRLEAERFDISYKQFKARLPFTASLTPGEKRVLEQDLIAKGEARRRKNKAAKGLDAKTIWDAGRFAAGARDAEAIAANDQMRANR